MITQCWNNGAVTLQYGMTKIRYNIRHNKQYKSDTNVEDIKCLELMVDDVTLGKYQLYTSIFVLNPGTKNYNRILTGT